MSREARVVEEAKAYTYTTKRRDGTRNEVNRDFQAA
jgi:hypothetical protein